MNRRSRARSISVNDDLWGQVEQEAATTGQPISAVVVHALAQFFRSQAVRNSSWDTDDSEAWYDETKFYTFSQDKFGHSARFEVTIPKMVAGEIMGLIESGKVPELRTAQDFYRNAVRHQIYRTGRMLKDETLIEAAHSMTLQDRVASNQAAITEYEKFENQLCILLDEELYNGHYSFVEEELRAMWDGTSSINERFRDRFIDVLNEYQDKLRAVREHEEKTGTRKGEIAYGDGQRTKNGVNLAPKDRYRRNHQDE